MELLACKSQKFDKKKLRPNTSGAIQRFLRARAKTSKSCGFSNTDLSAIFRDDFVLIVKRMPETRFRFNFHSMNDLRDFFVPLAVENLRVLHPSHLSDLVVFAELLDDCSCVASKNVQSRAAFFQPFVQIAKAFDQKARFDCRKLFLFSLPSDVEDVNGKDNLEYNA